MEGEKTGNTAAELGKKLTDRERAFVREYLVDLNGTRAAIRAHYAEKSAASQASRLLRKPEVQAYRDALLQEQFDAIGITQHSIAAEVWKIFERCTQQTPVKIWDSTKHEYVFAGVWEFDVKGALKALDMLRQMLPEMKRDGDTGEGGLEELLMSDTGGREF